MLPGPPRSTLFPYTTLFRSSLEGWDFQQFVFQPLPDQHIRLYGVDRLIAVRSLAHSLGDELTKFREIGALFVRCGHDAQDRKSTRLNSSHVEISYAVFCLKK